MIEKVPQIDEEREKLITKLKTLRDSVYLIPDDVALEEALGQMVAKRKSLEVKYPDFEDYELYHLLGSSTPDSPPSKLDFPGEDSVAKFLHELINNPIAA